MANNKIQIKRTTVSGRTANTTNAANAAFIDKGELAVNLADRKLFSSDAANALFEVGSNLTNLSVTTSATLKNDVSLNFETVNGNTVTMKQQSDDNFVFYTTNTAGGQRAVWSIYANSVSSNLRISTQTTFNGNVDLNIVALYANGSPGTAGQVLTSNGQSTYWQSLASITTNVNATYAWTNTHSFAANVSFGNSISLTTGNSSASGGMLFFAGLGDANWKMGRNTNGATKWFYTNNTIDIIAAGSPLEGVVIGQNGGNTFLETGYAGTFLAGNVTIGNTASKSTINSTAFSGTANNANFLGSNSASDLRTYSDTKAATAYSNAVSYTDTKIGTANTAMAANAATAYSNAVSYTDGKIATANSAITGNAATAYTNATIFAANASNANNGTLAEARLPYRMNQNVRTIDNVEFVNVTVTGNITVSGTQSVIGGNSLSITDNMIYMNQGVSATITNVSGNGSVVTFTANNNYSAGWDVTVISVNPTSYNGTYLNIVAANATHFQVSNTNTASYVSGGTARGKTESNPDLGFAFGYNDGSYHHGGFFRDASDGIFKVFDNYDPEPDTSVYIDTANNTFHLANFQANVIYVGNTTVYSTINTTSFSGTANNATNLGGSSLATIQGQITGNAATAYTNSVSYVDTKISTANTAMAANAATAYSNAVSYTDTKIGTANTAMAANAATAYSNAVSYTDTKIGTANTAMAANAATAYSNAVSYTDTKIGTANTAMVANAAAAYTNAIAIAANASNITSGTVAFARLPALYLGTTAIQSTSAAQAVSGITTLAAGNTTITGFANVTGNLTATNPIFNNIKHGYSTTATAAGTTVLTSSSNYQQFFTGTTTQIVSLPAPQTMTLGQGFLIVNNSTGNLEVRAANAAVVATVLPGMSVLCVSIDLTAGNGAAGWSAEVYGFSAITGTGSVVLSASPTFSGTVTLASSGLSSNGSLGTAGQTLHSNGSATYWAADDGITSLVAANGINGGTITSTGTISVLGGSTLTVNTAGVHVNSTLSITSLALAGSANGITTLAAGNTTISGFANVTGGISLSGGTSNILDWSTAGVDGPTINTRSPGTKLLLYPALSASQTDYAMGISPATIWSTVPSYDPSFKFKWYGADVEVAFIDGTGNFKAAGYANVGTTLQVGVNTATFGTAAYIVANGNVGVGTSAPGSKLVVNGTASFGNTSITDLVVSGNLTVSGTRTYVNTTTLDVGDNIITLNADLGASAPSENAGIEVMRGTSANVQFIWDETNDRWSTNAQPLAISSLVAAGAASGITTLAAGNTTITGFANVTSTLQVGNSSVFTAANSTAVTTAGVIVKTGAQEGNFITSATSGNDLLNIRGGNYTHVVRLFDSFPGTNATPYANISGGYQNQARLVLSGFNASNVNNLTSTYSSDSASVANAAFVANSTGVTTTGFANVATTLAAGNTTITGFANVTGTIQGGSSLTVAGALSGVTTAAMGNTTITGFANVSTSLQVGTNTATFGTTAYIIANGNVGIGTSSPSFRFQVETDADANAGTFIRNSNTGTTAAGTISVNSLVGGISMRAHSAAHGAWPNSTLISSDTGFTGGLNFAQAGANPIRLWTNGSERMRIDSSGNLGIGTTTPSVKLHLFDSAAPEARLQIGTNSSEGAYTFYSSSTKEAGIGFTPVSAMLNISSGRSAAWGGTIAFTTDTTERMRIAANGNIGIGNAAPADKLSINGTTYHGGITTFAANVVLGSSGVSANGGFGTAGQVLHSNGTATYWAADDNSGTVTSIATANGLSGGTITTSGTLGVTTGSTLTVNTTGIHVNSNLSIATLAATNGISSNNTVAIYYGANDNFSTGFNVYKRGNTADANGAIATNAELGYNAFYGYNGTTYRRGAYFIAQATEAWSNTALGTRVQFATTPNGSNTSSIRLTLEQNGDVTIGGNILGGASVNATSLTVGSNFIANTTRVVIGTAVGLQANGGIGTAGQVLHSNGTSVYWAADDDTNTTYDLVAVANTAVNAGLLRLTDSSSSNDTVTFTGTGTSNVSSNATHIIINSADQFVGTVTSLATANGLSGGTITTSGTLGVTTGSTLTVNSTGIHVNSALSIASLALSGDITVSGNLTVSGTRTYVNTTTLDVGDNIITLNADLGASAPSQNAGIEIMRGTSANVQFLWDETNDRWSTNDQPIAVSSLVAAGAASGITTLAAGNTTITGFANVTSTIQGGSSLTIAGAASGITTLAAGNTTITGFANVTSTLQVGGVATFAANANFDSGVLFVDGVNNRVGIGNTAPTTTLHLQGNALVGGDGVSNYDFKLQRLNGGIRAVQHDFAAAANSPWILHGENLSWTGERAGTVESTQAYKPYYEAYAPAVGYKEFGYVNATSGSFTTTNLIPNLVLAANGNVGIGTTAPAYKLDVNGASYFSDNMLLSRTNTAGSLSGITITNAGNTSSYSGININSGTVSSQFFNDAAGNAVVAGAILRTTSNHPLVIGTNNAERMRVAANGYVGIGTASPATTLDVNGAITSSGSTNPYLALNNGTAISYVQVSSGALDLRVGGANPITFNTNSTERMRIDSSGNTGIGNTAPANKLFVTGDIGLDGISVRDTATLTTTATTQTTLVQYPTATYNTGELTIQAVSNGVIHTTKMLVVCNTTVAIATEYGSLLTGSSLYTVDCDISAGNTRIRVTPATTVSTAFKASYELITA